MRVREEAEKAMRPTGNASGQIQATFLTGRRIGLGLLDVADAIRELADAVGRAKTSSRGGYRR